MSFDEGIGDSFNQDDFKARLQSAMREEDISLHALCARAGVALTDAIRAIEYVSSSLYAHLEIFDKLARALGRDLNWLLTGVSSDSTFSVTVRERAHQLTSEYIYRAEVPQPERKLIHQEIDRLVDSLQTHTPQAAYRRGLPRNWKDVARIHQRVVVK